MTCGIRFRTRRSTRLSLEPLEGRRLLSTIGDSNQDGAFNRLDIVHVLQAAKYLTEEPATFEEGDWTDAA
jgi:hypothetical protein